MTNLHHLAKDTVNLLEKFTEIKSEGCDQTAHPEHSDQGPHFLSNFILLY